MGDGLAFLAIPLVVLSLTGSPFAAALSSAPRTVGYLAVGLIAGALVDRFHPRLVMMLMDVVRLGVFLSLALLAHAGALRVWLVLALALLASSAGVFFDTALAVMVRDLARGERLVRANSWLEATNQTSLAVGPGLFGLLTAVFGLHTALFGNAATYLCSLLAFFAISGRQVRVMAGETGRARSSLASLRHDIAEGLRYLRSSRLVSLLTMSQAFANFFLAATTLIPYFAHNVLGLGSSAVGLVVGAGGVGGVAGALAASRLGTPLRQLRTIVVSTATMGLSLGAMGLVGSAAVLAALNFGVCASSVLALVLIRSTRQAVVPRALLGRVTATARMTALAASPLGIMIAGGLAGLHGGNPRLVFVGAGVLAAAAALFVWLAGLRTIARAAQLPQ
ncbi:MFS transporter [Streptomyces sulfonofaciens]|uniref:MFS transporter n=2 Tax=Streptomyces sulfonofaciens TaxID=68272 RepID=A0A919FSP2_9ACTN|nr:MFS transporter [Streptomyces sulfonofaciens]